MEKILQVDLLSPCFEKIIVSDSLSISKSFSQEINLEEAKDSISSHSSFRSGFSLEPLKVTSPKRYKFVEYNFIYKTPLSIQYDEDYTPFK